MDSKTCNETGTLAENLPLALRKVLAKDAPLDAPRPFLLLLEFTDFLPRAMSKNEKM